MKHALTVVESQQKPDLQQAYHGIELRPFIRVLASEIDVFMVEGDEDGDGVVAGEILPGVN